MPPDLQRKVAGVKHVARPGVRSQAALCLLAMFHDKGPRKRGPGSRGSPRKVAGVLWRVYSAFDSSVAGADESADTSSTASGSTVTSQSALLPTVTGVRNTGVFEPATVMVSQ